jgi:hypothetical protein
MVMPDPSELISGYLDDQLTDEEFVLVQIWLAEDPAHIRQFVRQSFLHSRVRDILQQHDVGGLAFSNEDRELSWIDPSHVRSLLDEEAEADRRARQAIERSLLDSRAADEQRELLSFHRKLQKPQPSRLPAVLTYAGVAAAAAVLVVIGQFAHHELFAPTPQRAPMQTVERQPDPIATVVDSLDAAWSSPALSVADGTQLMAGSYSLRQGVVKVMFGNGATLLLEGPAEVELMSRERAKLNSGRVVANVPEQAVGFTLISAAAAFVDLGTEFGVEVTPNGDTLVTVLDGEVALVRDKAINSGRSQTLQVGATRTVSADGRNVSKRPFDESYFIREVPPTPADLAILQSRPLAYWPLNEPDGAGKVADLGRLSARGSVGNGVDLGNTSSAAGAKSLAAFSILHDGINVGSLQFSTERNFTCEAWVMAKNIMNWPPQRILSSFNRPPCQGFAFGVADRGWYRLPEQGPFLHVTAHGVYDCVSVNSIPVDQWVHLAASLDEMGEPQLYINGKLVSKRFRKRDPIDTEGVDVGEGTTAVEGGGDDGHRWETFDSWDGSKIGLVSEGMTMIGRNPPDSDGRTPPERWQGQLGGVAIYDRALSAEEIVRHYEAGRANQ